MSPPTRILRAYWRLHHFRVCDWQTTPSFHCLIPTHHVGGNTRPIVLRIRPRRQSAASAAIIAGRWLANLFRGLSVTDFFASLVALNRWAHIPKQPETNSQPQPTHTPALRPPDGLHEAAHYLKFANATFGWKGALFFHLADARRAEHASWADVIGSAARGDIASACLHANVEPAALLFASPRSQPCLPAHYVFVDARRRSIVLAIRGTLSPADVLTDLQPWRVPFPPAPLAPARDLAAFDGMSRAALAVLAAVAPALEEALRARPGWNLVVTGVSLGAGTALLCTALLRLLRERALLPPALTAAPLRCIAFAPPPVLSGAPGSAAAEWVQSLPASSWFFDDDVVPRLSEDSSVELLAALSRVSAAEPRRWQRLAMRPETQARVAAALAVERPAWHLAWGSGSSVSTTSHRHSEDAPAARPPLRIPGRIFWVRPPPPATAGLPAAHTVTELAAGAPELAAPRLAASGLRNHIPDGLAHALRELVESVGEDGRGRAGL